MNTLELVNHYNRIKYSKATSITTDITLDSMIILTPDMKLEIDLQRKVKEVYKVTFNDKVNVLYYLSNARKGRIKAHLPSSVEEMHVTNVKVVWR